MAEINDAQDGNPRKTNGIRFVNKNYFNYNTPLECRFTNSSSKPWSNIPLGKRDSIEVKSNLGMVLTFQLTIFFGLVPELRTRA